MIDSFGLRAFVGLRRQKMDPVNLLDQSGVLIAGRTIAGGSNCVTLYGCVGGQITGCELRDPIGQAGSDGHFVKAVGCKDMVFRDLVMRLLSRPSRGDGVSLYACRRCVLERLSIGGADEMSSDKAAEVCIDGIWPHRAPGLARADLLPSFGHVARGFAVGRFVIAHGYDHRLESMTITGALEVSGAAYDGRPEVQVRGIMLRGGSFAEVYIHRPTVPGYIGCVTDAQARRAIARREIYGVLWTPDTKIGKLNISAN